MRRKRMDWVYRPQGEFSSTPGAYCLVSNTMPVNNPGAGLINARAVVLLDSVAYLNVLTAEGFANSAGMPAAARPEHVRRPTVYCVEGDIPYRLLQFLAGNQILWGWRLGWFEQDVATGELSVEADYSMFEPHIVGAVPQSDIVRWANDQKNNLKERFFFKRYGTGDASEEAGVMRVFWRGRSTAPTQRHCLALYFEGSGTFSTMGMSVQFMPAVRALISA